MRSTAVANDSLNIVSSLRVGHLVRQLVEDQARQFALGIVDEGVEQRVAAEPVASSRASSTPARRTPMTSRPCAAQLVGQRLAPPSARSSRGSRRSRATGKHQVLSVSDSSGRGDDVPHRGAAAEVGIAAVAAVVGQPQLAAPRSRGCAATGSACRAASAACSSSVSQSATGLAALHQRRCPSTDCAVVAQRRAAARQAHRRAGQQRDAEPDRRRPSPANRFTPARTVDQAVVERRRAAEVGQPLVRELVDVGAVQRPACATRCPGR